MHPVEASIDERTFSGEMAAPSPCGEDLEYDPAFVALQQASIGKSEQQFGTAIIPAEPPDWHRIEHDALALMQRSRDIRIMSLLTRAWTENEGLPGYARGLALLADTLERHWDAVHPGLQVGGQYDPMQRVNAIAAFADTSSLVRCLRHAPLLSGPSGKLSLRDAVAVLESGDHVDSGSFPGGGARLRAELGQGGGDTGRILLAVQRILETLEQLRGTLEAHLEAAWMPSFAPVEQPLKTVAAAVSVRRSLQGISGQRTAEGPSPTVSPAPSTEGTAGPPSIPGPAGIRDRDALIGSLQAACAFLEQSEPSHPAPILIRRALRLLQMNFHEIVRELLPEGLARLDALAGVGQGPPQGGSCDVEHAP